MKSRDNQIIRTVPLLRSLVSRLEAIQWDTDGSSGSPAFGSVRIYDLRDQKEAMKDLLGLDQRAALVIYDGEVMTNEVAGRHLQTQVVREVTILVTDRQLGDRNAALMGSAHNPGALLLADLVAEELMGPLAVSEDDAAGAVENRAWVEVVESKPMVIEGKLRDELVGRSTKLVMINIHSGLAQTDLGANHT